MGEYLVIAMNIIALPLMAVAVAVIALLAKREQSALYWNLLFFSVSMFLYAVFGFLQYYYLDDPYSPDRVKAYGILSDGCYFAFIGSWLRLLILLSGKEKILKLKTPLRVTLLYGVAAELIILFYYSYSGNLELTTEYAAAEYALIFLNFIYGLWVFVTSLRFFLTGRGITEKSFRRKIRCFSGVLAIYMLWVILLDYNTVTRGRLRWISEVVVDPLLILYALISCVLLFFFYKKDPLSSVLAADPTGGAAMTAEEREHWEVECFAKGAGLTGRETEIASLIYRGMSNPDIGKELFISEHTVKRHLNAIFRKSGVKNRYELISAVGSHRNVEKLM